MTLCHPFGDGNGRTGRALPTTELWRGGYDMRSFLSLEEHYMANLLTETWAKLLHDVLHSARSKKP